MIRTIIVTSKSGESSGVKKAYFILIYGDPLGQMFEIEKKETIFGRDEKADFFIDDPCISRKHAQVLFENGTTIIKDLGSTNGTFVNDVKVTEKQLFNGDRISLGRSCFKFSFTDEMEEDFYRDFFKLATRDGLTDTLSRAYIMELFQREVARVSRYRRPLSVLMVDIDYFKKINDTFGHLAGDYVLREIAKTISANIRSEDLFGRYGGEEFLIIFPDLSLRKAKLVAEKIRSIIDNKEFKYNDQHIHVTISIGVAAYSKTLHATDLLLSVADENLYVAKVQGRNRVHSG